MPEEDTRICSKQLEKHRSSRTIFQQSSKWSSGRCGDLRLIGGFGPEGVCSNDRGRSKVIYVGGKTANLSELFDMAFKVIFVAMALTLLAKGKRHQNRVCRANTTEFRHKEPHKFCFLLVLIVGFSALTANSKGVSSVFAS